MKPLETIYVQRAGRLEHTPETEMVFVEKTAETVTLTLDDGEALSFDLAELRSALGGA